MVKLKLSAFADEYSANFTSQLKALNDDEFNVLMDKAAASYASGACMPIEDFEKEFKKEINA